jgi:hypothetical protein
VKLEISLSGGILVLKKIATILSAVALSIPVIEPVNASPSQTKVAAQFACSDQGLMVVNPEYYGRTRSGLDIWICVETGYGRQAFITFNQGPYPVLACNMMQCQVIDITY